MRWPPSAHDWPHAGLSRQAACRGHVWHVQETGRGPALILLHGAGGATQSWRGLLPLLAARFRVIAVDLPGQGFTRRGARSRCGLDPMAADIAALAAQEGWDPAALIGHSAGGAIALRMALDHPDPIPVIGLNAALGNFRGVAGWLFPVMAKVLALNPLTAPMVAATMRRASVERLLTGTGSRPDAEMIRLYTALASDRAHVDGTLAMMAQWRLDGLLDRLDRIAGPVTLIAGVADLAVPPEVSREAAARLPHGRFVEVAGLGHLMHEEAPDRIAALIVETLARDGIGGGPVGGPDGDGAVASDGGSA